MILILSAIYYGPETIGYLNFAFHSLLLVLSTLDAKGKRDTAK
jgi:hypothetical protein